MQFPTFDAVTVCLLPPKPLQPLLVRSFLLDRTIVKELIAFPISFPITWVSGRDNGDLCSSRHCANTNSFVIFDKGTQANQDPNHTPPIILLHFVRLNQFTHAKVFRKEG